MYFHQQICYIVPQYIVKIKSWHPIIDVVQSLSCCCCCVSFRGFVCDIHFWKCFHWLHWHVTFPDLWQISVIDYTCDLSITYLWNWLRMWHISYIFVQLICHIWVRLRLRGCICWFMVENGVSSPRVFTVSILIHVIQLTNTRDSLETAAASNVLQSLVCCFFPHMFHLIEHGIGHMLYNKVFPLHIEFRLTVCFNICGYLLAFSKQPSYSRHTEQLNFNNVELKKKLRIDLFIQYLLYIYTTAFLYNYTGCFRIFFFYLILFVSDKPPFSSLYVLQKLYIYCILIRTSWVLTICF